MADYVPSATIMVGSLITIGILYVIRVPLLVLAVIAIFAIFYVWARHQDLFAADYRSAKLLETFTSYAPYIMVSAVIFLSLGYIFFLRGLSSGVRPATLPPQAPVYSNNVNTRNTINRNLNGLSNRNRENLLAALERAV